MFDDLKIEPSRYTVKLRGKHIGICVPGKRCWVFFYGEDGTFTQGPTPALAIAAKLSQVKSSNQLSEDSE